MLKENIENKDFLYDAFISYRHGDLDQFAAEKIHKMLETFKIPKIASDAVKKQEKNRIRRVFRDQDELPIASNLSENILDALKQSEFLIVICSPRTSESIWVRKEIETFISLHGREHVLAVLIAGEPADAFPKELRYEEKEIILPDGTIRTERIDVEPLAADIRGENRRQIEKKMKHEILRLAAPILGCGYDDLKQRHKERRIKRMLTAAFAASAVFLAFAAVSTVLALRIQKQSRIIEEQYREVMVRQAKTLADTSLRLLEEGDRLTGIMLAREALPSGDHADDKPYTERAQYALTEALQVYESGSRIMPSHLLQLDTEAEFFKISPSGERILAVDIMGRASVWEALSGKLLYFSLLEENISLPEPEQYGFLNDSQIILPKEECLVIYDIEEEKEVYRCPEASDYTFSAAGSNPFLAAALNDTLLIVDAENGEIQYRYELDTDEGSVTAMSWNEEGTLLVFSADEEKENYIVTVDIEKKKILNKFSIDRGIVSQLLFTSDNELIAAINADPEEKEMVEEEAVSSEYGSIGLLDINSGDWRWHHQIEKESIDEIKLGDGKELLYISYDSLGSLNLTDGTEVFKNEFDTEIAGCYLLSENNWIGMFRNGKTFYLNGDSGEILMYSSDFFKTNSVNVSGFAKSREFYATLPYASNAITIYENALGVQVEAVGEFLDSIKSVVFDTKGEQCLVSFPENSSGSQVMIVDAVKQEKVKDLEFENQIKHLEYMGKNEETIAIITADAVFFYDRKGELQNKIGFGGMIDKVVSVSRDGSTIAVQEYENIKILKLPELEQVGEFTIEEMKIPLTVGESMENAAAVSWEENKLYVLDAASGKRKNSVDLKASYVSALFMDEEEQLLFAAYMDNSVEIYDVKTLELLYTYTDLDVPVTGCKSLKGREAYLLRSIDTAYLCKRDSFEVIAEIPGYQDVISEQDSFAITQNRILAKVPVYELSDLLKEADRQLAGRELSKGQKQLYHIE